MLLDFFFVILCFLLPYSLAFIMPNFRWLYGYAILSSFIFIFFNDQLLYGGDKSIDNPIALALLSCFIGFVLGVLLRYFQSMGRSDSAALSADDDLREEWRHFNNFFLIFYRKLLPFVAALIWMGYVGHEMFKMKRDIPPFDACMQSGRLVNINGSLLLRLYPMTGVTLYTTSVYRDDYNRFTDVLPARSEAFCSKLTNSFRATLVKSIKLSMSAISCHNERYGWQQDYCKQEKFAWQLLRSSTITVSPSNGISKLFFQQSDGVYRDLVALKNINQNERNAGGLIDIWFHPELGMELYQYNKTLLLLFSKADWLPLDNTALLVQCATNDPGACETTFNLNERLQVHYRYWLKTEHFNIGDEESYGAYFITQQAAVKDMSLKIVSMFEEMQLHAISD